MPMFALALVPRGASGQTCGAIDATVTIVDMAESGGVGLRVRTLAEQALERLTKRSSTGRGVASGHLDPAPAGGGPNRDTAAARDSSPRKMRITVVHTD